jgi:glycosyltransferase involved in cell wall biosynthesis
MSSNDHPPAAIPRAPKLDIKSERLWDAVQIMRASHYYRMGLLYHAWERDRRGAVEHVLRWAASRFTGRALPVVPPWMPMDPVLDAVLPPELPRAPLPRATMEAQLRALPGDGPLFIFPTPGCPWSYLFQRMHQLARALAEAGHTVLYMTDGEWGYPDCAVRGALQIADRLFLYNDGLGGKTLKSLSRPAVLWQYMPGQTACHKLLPEGAFWVYDSIDEVRLFRQYPGIGADHRTALKRATVVVASADALRAKAAAVRPDCVLAPNATRAEDFETPTPLDWPELDRLRASAKVLIGYYGAVASWMDFDLVRSCARQRPDWTFLLLGDIYRGVVEPERLGEFPNIVLWNRVPYDRLPWLLSKFDVATIPFKVNEITRAGSQVKAFEYMAGGKPVVSTGLPECRKYAPIQIADTAEQFVAECERALRLGRDAEHVARLRACARENSWRSRAETVLAALRHKGVRV